MSELQKRSPPRGHKKPRTNPGREKEVLIKVLAPTECSLEMLECLLERRECVLDDAVTPSIYLVGAATKTRVRPLTGIGCAASPNYESLRGLVENPLASALGIDYG